MWTRQIIVFDLDGVLFHTVSRTPILDPAFWDRHWADADAQDPNWPMLRMANAMVDAGFHVCILTARPARVADPTLRALHRVGLACLLRDRPDPQGSVPTLVMQPDVSHDRVADSSEWKAGVLRRWAEIYGILPLLVIDDYKPNADAMRRWAPVLLYEAPRMDPCFMEGPLVSDVSPGKPRKAGGGEAP